MADREIEGSELSALIGRELSSAKQYDATELSDRRTLAVEYMRGEMRDTPPRPNGSQQTSRDFADTVAWMLPGIVRVFTGSDQMVQYKKVREENDDWSRDASEYTNHTFFRESSGYKVLYNATYDALQFGDGLACAYWEPQRLETKLFRDKTEMEVAALLEEGWQPTGIVKPGKPKTDLVQDPVMGDWVEAEVPTLTVKLAKEVRKGKICDITCKPENLLLNVQATEIETARFCAYLHDDKTRSDLMEMADDYGWDKDVIRELPSHRRSDQNDIQAAREGDRGTLYDSPMRSGDPIDLYECYMHADVDGDGIAEKVRVWWAGDPSGGKQLGNYEEWEDDTPYTHIPCYPVPHRADSQSVFDRTHDISRVKTVLLRGALDNLYATALPMQEVEEGSVKNPDILVSKKFGGLIWKTKGSAPIIPHTIPFFADKAFAGLQYMDEMIAKRTGVSRTTMALDPEALQNQSATANQNNKDAAYSQIELVARNMAEYGGWQKYFAKRLKLAIKYQQVRRIPAPKEPGGFREIDPSQWDPNMAVTINVGLGTGSRDRDMMMLNQVLQTQIGITDRLAGAGFSADAIDFIPKIIMTAERIAESSGLKNADEFYVEFDDQKIEQMKQQASQPQPNPELEKVRAQGEVQMQLKQVDAQVSQQESRDQAQVEVVKNQAQLEGDLATAAADRENAIVIETLKQDREDRRFFAQLASQERQKQMELQYQAEQAQAARDNAAQLAAMKPEPQGKAAN